MDSSTRLQHDTSQLRVFSHQMPACLAVRDELNYNLNKNRYHQETIYEPVHRLWIKILYSRG